MQIIKIITVQLFLYVKSKNMEKFLKIIGFIIIYLAFDRALDTTDGIMGWIFLLGFIGFVFWAFGGKEIKKIYRKD